MITIGFSTKEIDNDFIDHIKKTCGPKNIEIIPFENKGTHSLTEAYNIILDKSSNDIVVLCHDDIYFDKKGWGNKIIKHFDKNPEYGILGVAGGIELPKSAKWWEDPSKMRGIVNHEHEGKKWESKYSNSLGNKLDEVVITDGVFMSLHKNRIKKRFNEDIKGFHFYDISFTFENYLENVKIGVMYDVRITHYSIGQTNDEWENNRIKLSERYQEFLPKKIPQLFEHKPMKILLGCLFFQNLTGSELSTFEQAKKLKEMGHDVHVYSQIGGDLQKRAEKIGIKLYDIKNPPGFKVGDGSWSLNINGRLVKSEINKLYKVRDLKFDVIQSNHQPVTKKLLELYPNTPIVNIVRSTVLEIENPVISNKVKKYVAITPKVKDYITNNFDISENDVDVIYNITSAKRGKKGLFPNNYVLIPGTMNYLRKNMVYDMVEKTQQMGLELWLAGSDSDFGYAKELSEKYNHVKYLGVIKDLSDYYENAKKICGIYLGRVLLEASHYNVDIIAYDIDLKGNITNILNEWKVNNENDLDRDFIGDKFFKLYKKVINE